MLPFYRPPNKEGIMGLNPQQMKVALLAGGTSDEREISLASGRGAADALQQAGFQVKVLDPAKKDDLAQLVSQPFDVAFLCLHGRGGEDGAIQGFLETIGLPYIGPGIWSSATAMDKVKAKVFYREYGIPTPQSITLHRNESIDAATVIARLGNHLVVKPATEGSALGVSIIEGPSALDRALTEAFKLDNAVLIETFMAGTELTVAVIGNENASALPVIEIVPQLGEFYDFESKYAADGSQHICPARLTDEQTTAVQQVAVQAHKALDCCGVSRSDVILAADGTPWVLETNTIPGMTATSLLPDAGRAAGMSFPQLCTRLIELALER